MAAQEVEQKAPEGKFRLVLIDIGVADGFTGGPDDPCSFLVGDYDTLEKAKEVYFKKDGNGVALYIYDDKGECVFDEFKAMDEPQPPQIVTIEIEEVKADKRYRGIIKGFTDDSPDIRFDLSAPMLEIESRVMSAKTEEELNESIGFAEQNYELQLVTEGKTLEDPRLTPDLINGFFFMPISTAASLLIDVMKKSGGKKGTFRVPLPTEEFMRQFENPEELREYVLELNELVS